MQYRLYGLGVASNVALPGLAETGSAGAVDVLFHVGSFPPEADLRQIQGECPVFTSSFRGPNGNPLLLVWHSTQTGYYCFHYCEGLTFLINGEGREVWARWRDPVTLEDATAFLLGQVFAFVLHVRGLACLHASAASVEGQAVLFLGDSGAGKSSTVAALAERGCPVLTDDVSAIRKDPGGKLVLVPGFPRVCLLPDSAEFLYGSGTAGRFPRVQPCEDKRLVRLDSLPGKFQDQPAQLGVIYLLAPRGAQDAPPKIEPVEDANRLIHLLANGFVSLALEPELRASEFRLLGEIARSVPVQRLTPSSDPGRLGQLCELVVNDIRATNASLVGRTGRA